MCALTTKSENASLQRRSKGARLRSEFEDANAATTANGTKSRPCTPRTKADRTGLKLRYCISSIATTPAKTTTASAIRCHHTGDGGSRGPIKILAGNAAAKPRETQEGSRM